MKSDPENILLETIVQHLRSSSLRYTKKRERILQVMVQLKKPENVATIREIVGLPESDLVTVYRNMEAFVNIGVVQRIPLENGSHLFELVNPGDHYHHFICRQCHRTERLDLCLGNQVATQAQNLGFSQVSHVMEVYGTCAECSDGSDL